MAHRIVPEHVERQAARVRRMSRIRRQPARPGRARRTIDGQTALPCAVATRMPASRMVSSREIAPIAPEVRCSRAILPVASVRLDCKFARAITMRASDESPGCGMRDPGCDAEAGPHRQIRTLDAFLCPLDN